MWRIVSLIPWRIVDYCDSYVLRCIKYIK